MTQEAEWQKIKFTKPVNSSKSKPIWIASTKHEDVTMGYWSDEYQCFFDMGGNGVSGAYWAWLEKPKSPTAINNL